MNDLLNDYDAVSDIS